MQTNFGGSGLSGFGNFSRFCLYSGYSPWGSKNLIYWNRLNKFMQVGVNVTCMYTNFGGCSPFGFGDFSTFKNGQISLSDHGLYPWSAKNLIDWLKKFMLVGIDVTCMHTNFWWVEPFWFWRFFYFQKRPNFPFRPWTIVHGQQKN